MRAHLSTDYVYADSEGDLDHIRELFREYAAPVGFEPCFQSFEEELAGLPGEYAPPQGRLFLAVRDGEIAGCVALRKLSEDACEMRRLYVRPEHRGRGIGRGLAKAAIGEARKIGYGSICLETLPSMAEAIALYRSLGFRRAEPYGPNPIEGAIHMELKLRDRPDAANGGQSEIS